MPLANTKTWHLEPQASSGPSTSRLNCICCARVLADESEVPAPAGTTQAASRRAVTSGRRILCPRACENASVANFLALLRVTDIPSAFGAILSK
jgi:hypothetical protein